MQFISSTAGETAEEADLAGFVREDLYDPATSILLGARYLAKLFREFPNEYAAVAASYNAGEDRMLRWYRRTHSAEPDRYVPEIRFGQTKDYVRKVMANYRAYKYLYDARLNLLAGETESRTGW
jgi:soluble lytic murein transglycosylase